MGRTSGEKEMNELISPEYLDQLVKLHSTRQWGVSGHSHAPYVDWYMRALGAKTVLDYGCGRGTLKQALLDKNKRLREHHIQEYDPAFPGKSTPPVPADLLVANDVLEHIEPDKLEATLKYMRSLAIVGAYFTICTNLSKVSLPDGRNAHLIVEPQMFWMRELKKAGFSVINVRRIKGLWVRAR
jgi:hypothetical protein